MEEKVCIYELLRDGKKFKLIANQEGEIKNRTNYCLYPADSDSRLKGFADIGTFVKITNRDPDAYPLIKAVYCKVIGVSRKMPFLEYEFAVKEERASYERAVLESRNLNAKANRIMDEVPSVEDILESRNRVARTIEDLPALKEGWLRLTHLTSSGYEAQDITRRGFDYSKKRFVSQAANVHKRAEDVKYDAVRGQDLDKCNYDNVKSIVVMDVPSEVYHKHNDKLKVPQFKTGGAAWMLPDGRLPAKYVVGVIYRVD